MTCIQSAYADCGLSVKAVVKEVASKHQAITTVVSLKSYFKDQPLLKRKQIQYALKELGVYSSSVDGLWGNGTAKAVGNYQKLQDLQTASPSELFDGALAKVDVPRSFAAPKKVVKKKTPTTRVNTGGLSAIVANPSMSGVQALAICKPQAELAKSQARSAVQSVDYGSSINCSGSGLSVSCSSYSNSGGFAGGFADGMSRSLAGRKAYSRVLDSCLAQYGWRD